LAAGAALAGPSHSAGRVCETPLTDVRLLCCCVLLRAAEFVYLLLDTNCDFSLLQFFSR
jgi:hypothetical protein